MGRWMVTAGTALLALAFVGMFLVPKLQKLRLETGWNNVGLVWGFVFQASRTLQNTWLVLLSAAVPLILIGLVLAARRGADTGE